MQNGLKIKSVIEVVGAPKEHVDESMKTVIEKLSSYKGLKLVKHDIHESEKLEDTPFWSTFCDLEADVEDTDVLAAFCIDFLPSSVEIVEPLKLNIDNLKMNHIFNDFLARFHDYSLRLNNAKAENILLKRKYEKKEN